MADMLVKLYDLPDCDGLIRRLEGEGINIRRAMVPDMYGILEYVGKTFDSNWKGECAVCFSRQPVSCFIAEKDGKLLGFACYNATMPDFFGPTGVSEDCRGKGVGAALLLRSLMAMRDEGYAYAIIGGVGPVEFYSKVCGAKVIEDSTPGAYKDFIGL
jgi:predicted GNAT family acetyltransferase